VGQRDGHDLLCADLVDDRDGRVDDVVGRDITAGSH
jgi:hypothetical protein